MAYFAVEVVALQKRLAETEVVVEAATADEALNAALKLFVQTVDLEAGEGFRVISQNISTLEPREVSLAEDPGKPPYVYDTYHQVELFPASDVFLGIEPDLDSIPWSAEETAEELDALVAQSEKEQEEDLPFVSFQSPSLRPPPEAPAVVVQTPPPVGPRTTSTGTPLPMVGSFESRPTAGLPRPLTTTEKGYTPTDGEFRHHPVRPYYLGGPAPIQLGSAIYTGLPAPDPVYEYEDDDWEQDWDNDWDDDWEDDEYYDNYEHEDWEDEDDWF